MEAETMTLYHTTVWGEMYKIAGDFADASSPVMAIDEDGVAAAWGGGRQVADFAHSPDEAMRDYLGEVLYCDADEDDHDEITAAIAKGVEHMRCNDE